MPFFLLCSLGGTDNLRGFSATEPLGRSLISAPGEYRGQLTKWLSNAVFADGGSVSDRLRGGNSDISYSAGAGDQPDLQGPR